MKPTISVIVPAYNEEAVLPTTSRRLKEVLDGLREPYEVIFVDDGSTDGTAEILSRLTKEDTAIRSIHFSRNFGQQAAITAGLRASGGEAVVIIDCDLQDPPEVIPEMVRKWREGYDIVCGRRSGRAGETFLKKATAWAFYRFLCFMSTMRIPKDTGDFRLVSRRVVDAVCELPEHNRYLRGMFFWLGFRQTEVVFNREARAGGETKYTIGKMIRLAGDGVLSFSHKPLEWVTAGGTLMTAAGIVWLLIILIGGLASGTSGKVSLICAFALFLAGLVITAVGIVGAYVARIFDEVKQRPLYVISERRGFQDGPDDCRGVIGDGDENNT